MCYARGGHRSNNSVQMQSTATVNLVQHSQRSPLPFCLHDPAALFRSIEITYPMMVSLRMLQLALVSVLA
jgi:hypothetical protein